MLILNSLGGRVVTYSYTSHQSQTDASHRADKELGREVAWRQRVLVQLEVGADGVVVVLVFFGVAHCGRGCGECFDVLVGGEFVHVVSMAVVCEVGSK